MVDTLQLSDALRKTGMEREQAEGLARTLGKELGAHVAEDVQSGFRQVRSDLGADIQQVRSDVQAVDTKVEVLRVRMDGLDSRLTIMFAGFGLILGILTVASGMGYFDRTLAPSQGVIESRSP